MRVKRVLVVLMATAGLLAGVGSSAASEGEPISSLVIDGISSDGYVNKASLEQRGQNPFNVKGYVDSQFVVGGGLFSMAGPATCLDVRGNTAGSIFRVEGPANSPFIGKLIYGSFVDGRPDRFAALPPLPENAPPGCAPLAAVTRLPFVRGGLVIKDGKIGNQGTKGSEK